MHGNRCEVVFCVLIIIPGRHVCPLSGEPDSQMSPRNRFSSGSTLVVSNCSHETNRLPRVSSPMLGRHAEGRVDAGVPVTARVRIGTVNAAPDRAVRLAPVPNLNRCYEDCCR